MATSAVAQWQKDSLLGSDNLRSLFFISDRIGFVISCDLTQSSWSNNQLLKTTDGGATWNAPGMFSELCAPSVFFASNDIGYFAPSGSSNSVARNIQKTTDGGTTWDAAGPAILSGSEFVETQALYFINDAVGFAVNSESPANTIRKTIDGGKSWSLLYSFPANIYVSSIIFTSSETGYAVGYDRTMTPGNHLMMKTTDGGNTWTTINSQYALLSVVFPSPEKGYAVGFNGTIVYSNDAGESWNIPASTDENQQTLRSVFCTDDNTCFAVGDNGTIMRTTDGGATWRKQISGTTRHLTSVACPDNHTCFAVGDSSTILKTTTGGETGVLPDEQAARRISIYPSNSAFTIRLASVLHNASMSVWNLFGQRVRRIDNQTGNDITMDSEDMPSGLYFLSIQQNNDIVYTGTFMIAE